MFSLLKTKTFWGGLGSIVSGAALGFTSGDWVNGGQLIATGLIAIFLRDGIRKAEL